MRGATPRQMEVLDYIRESIALRGYPPTLREIGSRLGIRSTNGVNDHIRALEHKGYITKDDMRARSIRLTNLLPVVAPPDAQVQDGLIEVPILGRVAAGAPLLAEEHRIDTLRVPPALLQGAHDVFGLRVQGDSMIDAGVLDGDTVFVEKRNTASRGDMVVALIEDEATVKYFFPEPGVVRFQPANVNRAPLLVHASDFRQVMILGVVVGVFRRVVRAGRG